jgi:hypothetical protein
LSPQPPLGAGPANLPEILRYNLVHIGHMFRPVDDST